MQDEIEFILATAKSYLNPYPTRNDILSIYAGLRPLAAPKDNDTGSTKEISRDHKLLVSDSNLITITGGKWTTYRKMAQDTVDAAIKAGDLPHVACRTMNLPIHGSTDQIQAGHWTYYGIDYNQIQALMQEDESLKELLLPEYEFTKAEVVWACRHEMIRQVEDFLARRCRLLLLDAKAAKRAAPVVADLMAGELGKSQEWRDNQIKLFNELANNYLL